MKVRWGGTSLVHDVVMGGWKRGGGGVAPRDRSLRVKGPGVMRALSAVFPGCRPAVSYMRRLCFTEGDGHRVGANEVCECGSLVPYSFRHSLISYCGDLHEECGARSFLGTEPELTVVNLSDGMVGAR
jgi:hypothetical protein